MKFVGEEVKRPLLEALLESDLNAQKSRIVEISYQERAPEERRAQFRGDD